MFRMIYSVSQKSNGCIIKGNYENIGAIQMKQKKETEKLKRQSFTCKPDEWETLLKTAESQEISVSALIRKLLKKAGAI